MKISIYRCLFIYTDLWSSASKFTDYVDALCSSISDGFYVLYV